MCYGRLAPAHQVRQHALLSLALDHRRHLGGEAVARQHLRDLVGREAARVMVPRGRGTILFTGATASMRGGAGFAAFVSQVFLGFCTHCRGHRLFGQIQQQLPVLGSVIKFLTCFVYGGTPIVGKGFLLVCVGEGFHSIDEQEGISLSFLQQVQTNPCEVDVEQILIEQHHGVQIFLCLFGVPEFHI